MDDFLKVLGVGVGLFVVAILVAAYIPAGPSGSPIFGGYGSKEIKNTTLLDLEVGTFGNLDKAESHQSMGNFGVGYVLGDEEIEKKDEVDITSGIFTKMSKSISFSGVETEVATLSFIMNDSNYYGPLVVELNGQEVYRNFTESGHYTFEFYDLEEENEVTIKAGSSGVRFWAPTVYELRGLELTTKRYGFRDHTAVFKVTPDEYNAWLGGRVVFTVDSSSTAGNLTVEINGRKVYEGSPKTGKPFYVDFTKFENDIVSGENTIRFTAEKDGRYELKNVDVIVYSNVGKNTILIKRFYFPEGPYYYYLKEEKANLHVELSATRNREGTLSFYLNDQLYRINATDYRFNATIPIDFDDITPHLNELRFRTTGIFTIDMFKIVFTSATGSSSSPSNQWSIAK